MDDRYDEMTNTLLETCSSMDMEELISTALRQVAEETRRECAEVLREHGGHCHSEEAEGLEFLAQKIEAMGTAPTIEQSSIVPDSLTDAAPDMLAALEGVLGMAENFIEIHMMNSAKKDPDIIRARAAIAKAKGVQP